MNVLAISGKDMCLVSNESTSIVEIIQRICNKQILLTLSITTKTFSGNARLKVVIVMVENTSLATSLDT